MVEPALAVVAGAARLKLGHHPDDADQRSVILTFERARHVSIGFPNDEGRLHHRLWDRGLDKIRCMGVVEDSELVAAVDRALACQSSLIHWVLLLKEGTAEVVAQRLKITCE